MPDFRGWSFQDIAYDRGGPEYYWGNDDCKIVRPVQINAATFNQLDDFVRNFIGYAYVDYGESSGRPFIRRVTPYPWSQILKVGLTDPFLFCTSIVNEPSVAVLRNDSSFDPIPEPVVHRMKMVFTAPTHPIVDDTDERMFFEPQTNSDGITQDNPYFLDDVSTPDESTLARYVSIYMHPFMRIITIPRAIPKWVLEDGDAGFNIDGSQTKKTPVWEGIGKPEPGMVVEMIWHGVPAIATPYTAIQRCMGKVNGWIFSGFPEQSLLCEAPRITPRVSVAGNIINDIHYFFRFLPKDVLGVARGHNYFLRVLEKTDGTVDFGYRLLSLDGTKFGSKVFDIEDFAYLFRAEGALA